MAISQKVLGLPTFIVYKNGEKIKKLVAQKNCTPEAIENLINEKHLVVYGGKVSLLQKKGR